MQGSAGSGKTTIGLHRIAYLAFADPRRFRPERMLVIVYQRALATYVSRVLPSLDVDGRAGDDVRGLGRGGAQGRASPSLDVELTDDDAAGGDARQVARRDAEDPRRPPGGAGRLVPRAAWQPTLAGKADGRGGAGGLGRAASGPVDLRVTALAHWVKRRAARSARRATRSRTPGARCARARAT